MKIDARWMIYCFFGSAGFVISAYLFYIAFAQAQMDHFIFFATAGSALAFISLVNFYTAYAFKFGVLSAVFGTAQAANLVRGGVPILSNAKIRLIRNFDIDNSNINDDQRLIIFVANWRPWVCPKKFFLN